MSDIQEDLYKTAQSCAFAYGSGQQGCPQTYQKALAFEPPLWVLKAMEEAYSRGWMCGINEKTEDFRKRLGL